MRSISQVAVATFVILLVAGEAHGQRRFGNDNRLTDLRISASARGSTVILTPVVEPVPEPEVVVPSPVPVPEPEVVVPFPEPVPEPEVVPVTPPPVVVFEAPPPVVVFEAPPPVVVVEPVVPPPPEVVAPATRRNIVVTPEQEPPALPVVEPVPAPLPVPVPAPVLDPVPLPEPVPDPIPPPVEPEEIPEEIPEEPVDEDSQQEIPETPEEVRIAVQDAVEEAQTEAVVGLLTSVPDVVPLARGFTFDEADRDVVLQKTETRENDVDVVTLKAIAQATLDTQDFNKFANVTVLSVFPEGNDTLVGIFEEIFQEDGVLQEIIDADPAVDLVPSTGRRRLACDACTPVNAFTCAHCWSTTVCGEFFWCKDETNKRNRNRNKNNNDDDDDDDDNDGDDG